MKRLMRSRARTLIGVGAVASLLAAGAAAGSVLSAGATPVPGTITACVSSSGETLYNVVQSPAHPRRCLWHDQSVTWSEGPTTAPQYAYIYDIGPNPVSSVAAGTDVPFANNGPMTSGITYVPATGQITIATAGVYQISFIASVNEPGQLELTQDATPLPNTLYGRATGTSEISGQAILTVAAGDVITLRNPSGNSPALTFTPLAGGTHPDVTASITIEQVG